MLLLLRPEFIHHSSFYLKHRMGVSQLLGARMCSGYPQSLRLCLARPNTTRSY